MAIFTCATCDKQFEKFPSQFSRNKSELHFCSRKCAAQRQQKALGNLTCSMCGKEFYRKPSERRKNNYCSRTCANQAQSRIWKELPLEKRQSPGVEVICQHCGKAFRVKAHRSDKAKFCSRPCAIISHGGKPTGISMPGNSNPNFRGTNNSVTARENGTKYFGRACMICGWDTIVDVHHITPRRHGGTNDLDNLIVLCPNHHRMADKRLIPAGELKTITRAAIAQLSDPPPLFHQQSPYQGESAPQPPLFGLSEFPNRFD